MNVYGTLGQLSPICSNCGATSGTSGIWHLRMVRVVANVLYPLFPPLWHPEQSPTSSTGPCVRHYSGVATSIPPSELSRLLLHKANEIFSILSLASNPHRDIVLCLGSLRPFWRRDRHSYRNRLLFHFSHSS